MIDTPGIAKAVLQQALSQIKSLTNLLLKNYIAEASFP